ncbi:MAG: T9SS type A sorting domain-containing protein [Chlorobi bacterium]|nr:T9SS type A sorting domain-containing protein [Chlorobiota bacterium]
MTKKLHIQILVLFLIIVNCTIGQSTLSVVNGGKMNISSGTSVQSQNMDIGIGSQLVSTGDLTVSGTLANDAGTFGLVIKSDVNGTGSLLHNSANVLATMEQCLASERWHLVSSPMANATIETYLDIYLKKWNETDSTWTYLTQPISMPMNASEGYSAWASDNLTGTVTVNYEGNLNNGDYPLSLAYTPVSNATGWNLLGNPYPSAIVWNLDNTWDRMDVGGWAVVYDNATFKGWNPYLTGSDRSYNGKTDGIIPATQGFWVRATSALSGLTIPQSQRTHNNQPFYKDTGESNYMSLCLKASANGYSDEAAIIFMDGASNGFDALYDLKKMYNVDEAPNISSKIEGREYSVNVLPVGFLDAVESPVIPVNFKLGIEGQCTITVSGTESSDLSVPIYLEDLQDDVMTDLRANENYVFSVSPLDDPSRFLLHFGEPLDIEEPGNSNTIHIYSHGALVYIRLANDDRGEAAIFDMAGKKVCDMKLTDKLTKKSLLQTGYFVVKVWTDGGVSIQKVFIKS